MLFANSTTHPLDKQRHDQPERQESQQAQEQRGNRDEPETRQDESKGTPMSDSRAVVMTGATGFHEANQPDIPVVLAG